MLITNKTINLNMEKMVGIIPIKEWEIYKQAPLLITGPCSAETEEQLYAAANELIKYNRVDVFRAGIWKPRTRPDTFEGVGREGLKWLRNIKRDLGLPIATEVANQYHVNEALKFGVDVLWIGARTSANPFSLQEIADALQGVDVTVLIKNPITPDLDLWIGAIERIYKAGVRNVAAIHRGFSSYEKSRYRNQPIFQLPIELKRAIPEISLICDPSHIGGSREYIYELSQKSMDLNYDGLMIESHCNPDMALSDSKQQVTPADLDTILTRITLRQPDTDNPVYKDVIAELRSRIDQYDDQLLDLLETRMNTAETIGKYKRENNITILQSNRWEQIINKAVGKGKDKGLSEEFICKVFEALHQESINHQNQVMNS